MLHAGGRVLLRQVLLGPEACCLFCQQLATGKQMVQPTGLQRQWCYGRLRSADMLGG